MSAGGEGRLRRGAGAAAVVAALGLLQACSTVPVAVKPVGCKVDDATLALRCEAPQPVADGITYGDVLSIGRLDRKALLQCQQHLLAALAMLGECRSTVEAYGKEIDKINQATAQR
ncbi:MAG: hypothetical protein JNL87_17285 [Burkholderiaceae bacterium]|nr:hypothetical protein [Burkholderiaceae bacterium]